MKHIKRTAALLLSGLFFACTKPDPRSVQVVRDCTGVYLKWNSKDYRVCNPGKLSDFADGAQASASFTQIKECNGSAKDDIVCMMLHENEGWIKVISIK